MLAFPFHIWIYSATVEHMEGTYSPALRVIALEQENRKLLQRIDAQDQKIAVLKQTIQDLQMQLAQLQVMIFKKKKVPPDDRDDDDAVSSGTPTAPRSSSSYRRATPTPEEITKTEEHMLDRCARCGKSQLEEVDVRSLYVEDLPEVAKEVIHHRIHVYHCIDCGRHQSSVPIPRGQQTILGPRVKARVLYLSYILHCSDTDIIRYLFNTYGLMVSQGEIHYVQRKSAEALRSVYNGIKDTLNQQESTHVDETGWQVGRDKQYAWGRVSPTTPEVLIQIGTRGKGNAEDILKGFSGCLTTDCYGAYKNLERTVEHQICWVHILREAKDVARSPYLTPEQRQSAQQFHQALQVIYHDVKQQLIQPFDRQKRTIETTVLQQRLATINLLLPCDTSKKLANIKLRTQEYARELFTCLRYKTALPENNLAERGLRHLVIKRKRSFGSATENGASIFAVNFSAVYSLWKRFPHSFFPELQKLLVD